MKDATELKAKLFKASGIPPNPATVSVLPCDTCPALCCGPIPLRQGELEAIVAQLRCLDPDTVRRVSRQEREIYDCLLLDMDSHRCLVYASRPILCSLYGRTRDMKCERASLAADEVSEEEARQQLQQAAQQHGELLGILGVHILWHDLQRKMQEEGEGSDQELFNNHR